MSGAREWAAIKDVFAIHNARPEEMKDTLTTNQNGQQQKQLSDEVYGFGYAVAKDLSIVFASSDNLFDVLLRTFNVLTHGNRGVIFGTVLVIMSLALLAMMPPVVEVG